MLLINNQVRQSTGAKEGIRYCMFLMYSAVSLFLLNKKKTVFNKPYASQVPFSWWSADFKLISQPPNKYRNHHGWLEHLSKPRFDTSTVDNNPRQPAISGSNERRSGSLSPCRKKLATVILYYSCVLLLFSVQISESRHEFFCKAEARRRRHLGPLRRPLASKWWLSVL